MTIYSGFTHWKWWFSIVMLVYQRVKWLKWAFSCSEAANAATKSCNVALTIARCFPSVIRVFCVTLGYFGILWGKHVAATSETILRITGVFWAPPMAHGSRLIPTSFRTCQRFLLLCPLRICGIYGYMLIVNANYHDECTYTIIYIRIYTWFSKQESQ